MGFGRLLKDKKTQITRIVEELINPLNSELNPTYHLLALLEAHHILHVSRIRVKAGRTTIRSKIHKIINIIWNKKELPKQWKVSIIVLIYKTGNKMYCTNYRRMSYLSSTCKILSSILPSMLTPHAE